MSAEALQQILNLIEQLTPEQATEVLELLHQREQLDVKENDTEANFRRGWHEAMTGQTRPISELWDEMDTN